MRIVELQTLKAFVLLMFSGVLSATAQQRGPTASPPTPQFTMRSSAFSDGDVIPVKYSCSAVSPALQWTNVPSGAVTYTLIFHDPDAPLPSKDALDITNWIMWNIPATLTQLPEAVPATAKMPDGTTQGINYRDGIGYAGPCPPPGQPHHYTFELYALDTKLSLGPKTERAAVEKAMDGHILAKAVYIGLFHR